MPGLNIAIVGAGAIAEKFYLPALKKGGDMISQLSVIDINAIQREKMAKAYGLAPYASLEAAAAAGVTAVIVAVPNRFHCSVAIEAMGLGMDVLVEKPLADTAAEAQKMIDFAVSSGRILAVNQTRRLFGTSHFIRAAVVSGCFGVLKSVRYEEGAQFNWASVEGAYTRTDLGRVGVIADLGGHVIDVIAWWIGDGLEFKRCRHDGWHGPEAFAHIELGGAAEASVKISRLGRMSNTFEVVFEKARLFGDIYNWNSISIEQDGEITRKVLDTEAKVYSDMAEVLLENFSTAVLEGRAPLFPAQLSMAGMKLIDECYEKAEKFEHSWYAQVEATRNSGGRL